MREYLRRKVITFSPIKDSASTDFRSRRGIKNGNCIICSVSDSVRIGREASVVSLDRTYVVLRIAIIG